MKKLFEQDPIQITPVEPTSTEPKEQSNNVLSEADQAALNRMYENIAKTSTQPLPGTKPTIQFSDKKGDITYNITGTPLYPLRSTMVGKGTFKSRYRNQLEKFVFTDGDINPDNLIPLIMLMEATDSGNKTIRVVSSQNKTLLKDIVIALNEFFKEHHSLIKGMYSMFKGSMTMHQKEQPDE